MSLPLLGASRWGREREGGRAGATHLRPTKGLEQMKTADDRQPRLVAPQVRRAIVAHEIVPQADVACVASDLQALGESQRVTDTDTQTHRHTDTDTDTHTHTHTHAHTHTHTHTHTQRERERDTHLLWHVKPARPLFTLVQCSPGELLQVVEGAVNLLRVREEISVHRAVATRAASARAHPRLRGGREGEGEGEGERGGV